MKSEQMLEYAKDLRRGMTEAEQRLWYHLRAHRFLGLKFKRQKPVGRHIVDFVCIEQQLVIELDGSQHVERDDEDCARDAWLAAQGFRVLRFWNDDVLRDTESVLEAVRVAVSDTLSAGPSPASGRGE